MPLLRAAAGPTDVGDRRWAAAAAGAALDGTRSILSGTDRGPSSTLPDAIIAAVARYSPGAGARADSGEVDEWPVDAPFPEDEGKGMGRRRIPALAGGRSPANSPPKHQACCRGRSVVRQWHHPPRPGEASHPLAANSRWVAALTHPAPSRQHG